MVYKITKQGVDILSTTTNNNVSQSTQKLFEKSVFFHITNGLSSDKGNPYSMTITNKNITENSCVIVTIMEIDGMNKQDPFLRAWAYNIHDGGCNISILNLNTNMHYIGTIKLKVNVLV